METQKKESISHEQAVCLKYTLLYGNHPIFDLYTINSWKFKIYIIVWKQHKIRIESEKYILSLKYTLLYGNYKISDIHIIGCVRFKIYIIVWKLVDIRYFIVDIFVV